MRAIIAGGRDYELGPRERRWLDGVHAAITLTEVVSGGAQGADSGGEAGDLNFLIEYGNG